MTPITPTKTFQVSALTNENLTAQINLFNDTYEVNSTVSVYILSSDLRLSDVNDNLINNEMITLDVENGNTTFQIYSNISSYCTNPSVKPSALQVQNLDYNKEIKLAVKITALSHTLQDDPIVIYFDNQRYSSFDLRKELSVNILPNLLQFTGTRSVVDDTIVKATNISCDYIHNPSQLYFTMDEIEYVTNSSGGFGILFNLKTSDAIPFETNLSCKLMNNSDISEYATIVETSPKHFTCKPLKSSESSIDAIFQTATGISATFPIMIWTDFDVSDPTKVIKVETGNGVIKNDSGQYIFALKDQVDENNFIRIQSVIPLEFEFSEIG